MLHHICISMCNFDIFYLKNAIAKYFCTSCIFIKHYFSYNLSILVHRPSLFISTTAEYSNFIFNVLLKEFHYIKCFRLMAFSSVSLFPSFSGLSDQTYTHTLRIFIQGSQIPDSLEYVLESGSLGLSIQQAETQSVDRKYLDFCQDPLGCSNYIQLRKCLQLSVNLGKFINYVWNVTLIFPNG